MTSTTSTTPTTRQRILSTAACLALGLLAGCASDDAATTSTSAAPATARATPADQRPAPKTELEKFDALGYRLEWRGVGLVSRGAQTLFFEPSGDLVLFQETGNTITCLDAATGRSRWATELETPITRFAGIARRDERVYAASQGELFVLDARTGEALERHRLAVVVTTAPLLVGDMAIFGGMSGEVLGHNLRSAYKLWGYRLSGSINGEPVRVGEAVGVVSQGGDVIVLDPANGASFGRARIFGALENNPVASDDLLFVASTDQSVYAFQRADGRLRWRSRNERPITDQPAVFNNRLYVSIPRRGMVCFDAPTGDVVWEAPQVSGDILGIRDGRLIAWNGREAVALDPANGDEVVRVEIPGLVTLAMDGFDNGPLYAVTRDGRIAKFGPRF